MMNSTDVTGFYSSLADLAIEIWLDGGWGVDALLGEQTRPHADLDIFIQRKDVPQLRELLEMQGYREIKLEIARPQNFVLGDEAGHEIDVHVIVFDAKGNARYGSEKEAELLPADVFQGTGFIDGRSVKCIAPETMVEFHDTGYKLREIDYQDVFALCRKFGIDLPAEYIR